MTFEKMEQYRSELLQLDELREKYKELKSGLGTIKNIKRDTPGQAHNKKGYKTEHLTEEIYTIDQIDEKIANLALDIFSIKADIYNTIELIDNPFDRALLMYRYMRLYDWETIGEKMKRTPKALQGRLKKSIRIEVNSMNLLNSLL